VSARTATSLLDRSLCLNGHLPRHMFEEEWRRDTDRDSPRGPLT
jgi:hypothetical protein